MWTAILKPLMMILAVMTSSSPIAPLATGAVTIFGWILIGALAVFSVGLMIAGLSEPLRRGSDG
jgi:hypothetical protein